jgi:flagellar motor switch protein FliN
VSQQAVALPPVVDLGPLAGLPRVSGRQARLERLLGLGGDLARRLQTALAWLTEPLGKALSLGTPEVAWRASGLQRPGVMAQLSWPRRSSRLGLGIETPLAHALVDRLLGFERRPGEDRLQVTPVEWGILTYIVARTLTSLAGAVDETTAWDLVLDRVSPEPFHPEGLGALVTVRWPVTVGATTGSIRAWLPESLLLSALAAGPPVDRHEVDALRARCSDLAGLWSAEAGTVRLAQGVRGLRAGTVLPLEGGLVQGSPADLTGTVELSLRDREGRSWFPAEPVPMSGGGLIALSGPLQRIPTPREALAVPTPSEPSAVSASADVPVTLVVELGRISLPLHRLAELKPGEILELGRHAKEPVELTSGGRLVARGELVQIDTELGVRLMNVLL